MAEYVDPPGFLARMEVKYHLRAALDWVDELDSDELIRVMGDDIRNALDHLLDLPHNDGSGSPNA